MLQQNHRHRSSSSSRIIINTAIMFHGFEPFDITTQQGDGLPTVTIHGLKSTSDRSLPPLLLLHGFPQTLHIWHRVAPRLISRFQLVLFDIRGYGASSKPAELEAYAKSAMARDCIAVMDALGFKDSSFYVCAHDRGARVAHKLCVDFPARVKSAILLDICPTLAMYTKTDLAFAKAYFHWFFLIQKEPLPETLINAAPRRFAELFMGGRQTGQIFDDACWEEYVKVLEDPVAVHAMCQDYRAASTLDLEESRKDLEAGRKMECPLMVLWGKYGVIEACFDAVEEWRAVAKDGSQVSGRSVESGHYVPEHAPDDVVSSIEKFFI
jgi:pimeloyl-ACP methyl ester carboxylesterase